MAILSAFKVEKSLC